MKYKLGVFFAFINSLSLGISGIVDKVGASHYPSPFIFSTHSISFSLLFSILFAFIFLKADFLKSFTKVSFSSWKLIFSVGIFGSGLFVLFRFLGLTHSTGTFATLGQVITTSSTALLAAIFLKERLSKTFWAFFAIIIMATYLVSIGRFTLTTLQNGDIYILIGALFLACGNLFSQLAIKKVSPVMLTVGRFFFGCIFLVLANIFLFQNSSGLLTFNIWALISGLFWAITILVFNFAIQRISITLALSIIMTAPVYTMLLEHIVLKQSFNLLQIIAAMIVVISGVLIVYLKNK